MKSCQKHVMLNMKKNDFLILFSISKIAKNDYVQALILINILCLIFLYQPITNYESHTFSPSELLQKHTILRIVDDPLWVNPYLGDVVYVIHPWLMYNRDSIRAGQLPLWNPYSGNGMPHLANFQSSVFSIFTIPFYILEFKLAVLISSFLSLFAHGIFTFLFLKQIGLHQSASLIGALAYMFGGYHVIWLGWLPLLGSGVAMPAGLYFVEAVFNRFSGDPAKPTFWPLVGFSVSLLCGLLAGHPETFYAALFLVAVYVLLRLIRLLRDLGPNKNTTRLVIGLGGRFVIAALMVPLIASIQLIPFFEYLSHSLSLNSLNKSNVKLPLDILPLLIFPNSLGNPSESYSPIINIQNQLWNFPESNSLYLGGLILLLAILSIILVKHNWYARFFGLVALLWFEYIFNLFSSRELFKLIPGVSVILPIRTYDIWLFSVSCSAALLIDHAWKSSKPNKVWALIILCAGMVLWVAAWLSVSSLWQRFSDAVLKDESAFVASILAHVQSISVSLLVGIILLALLFLLVHSWQRQILISLLGLAIFYQNGLIFISYNPIVRDSIFYPITPILRRLQYDVNQATLLILGRDTIPPNVNMVYRLRLPTGYDGFWARPQRRLYRHFFDAPAGALIPAQKAEPRALQLFGIEWIATIDRNQDLAYRDDLKLFWQENKVHLYRYVNSLTRYFTVDAAVHVADEDQAWELIRSPEFDPARFVILVSSEAAASLGEVEDLAHARPARVLLDQGNYIRLETERAKPGYLVLAVAYDPGWKVKVNNESRPVLRANYAFSAVALPAGRSVIEFYYDPDSFKLGAILSLSGLLLAGVICVAYTLRRFF